MRLDEEVPDESTVRKLTRRLEAENVVEQIRRRLAGEPIEDRLVSIFDPDARPIRKGQLDGSPATESAPRAGSRT